MSERFHDTASAPAAERLARAAHAARALSETLWEALHEELARSGVGEAGGSRARELSERLGEIATTVALLAPASSPAPSPPAAGPQSDPTPRADARRSAGERVAHEETREQQEAAAARPQPPARPPDPTATSRAVLVDERVPTPSDRAPSSFEHARTSEPASAPSEPASAPFKGAPAPAERASVPSAPASALSEPAPSELSAPPEIAIRDERVEEARRRRALASEEERPDPWVAAIARRVEIHKRDHAPFAVLVAELADVERLRHAELPGEMARLTGLVESALAGQLGPADSLTRATPGRYWLLAAQTGEQAAHALAERLAGAVRAAASHRGAPLGVAIGIAVCPDHATRAGALAAHAEIALYAARAAGRPVAP